MIQEYTTNTELTIFLSFQKILFHITYYSIVLVLSNDKYNTC